MKLYQEPVDVQADRRGRPSVIHWRGQAYTVAAVQEKWLFDGKWWTRPGLGGIRRRYYRVSTHALAGATVVMVVYEESGAWVLAQVLD